MISPAAGPIWLIDATTYHQPLEARLHRAKDRFLRIERHARSQHIGSFSPRGTRTYSAGLLRIATILAANGHAVRYLPLADAVAALEDPADIEPPAVIGFGAVCPTLPACVATAELARRRIPGLRTVLGGPHALVAAQMTAARHWAAFDEISKRFDSEAAAELVGVPALALRRPGEHLDYDLLPRPLAEYGLNLMTTSGCPFTCSYCQDRLVPRMRSRLDGGLGRLLERWPLPDRTPVHICDSVLGGGVARALEVCRELAELDHRMVLSCDLRPELISRDFVLQVRKAPFSEVRLGLDSADEAVLTNTGRSAKPTRLLQALQEIRETSELYVSIYMVTGLPGTTTATLDRNLQIVQRLLEDGLADQIKHHLYVPYPSDQPRAGTPQVRLRTDDWSRYDRNSYPVYDLPGLSQDDLWAAFLTTEEAINEAWARALGLDGATIASLERYPDYNGAVYLDGDASPCDAGSHHGGDGQVTRQDTQPRTTRLS